MISNISTYQDIIYSSEWRCLVFRVRIFHLSLQMNLKYRYFGWEWANFVPSKIKSSCISTTYIVMQQTRWFVIFASQQWFVKQLLLLCDCCIIVYLGMLHRLILVMFKQYSHSFVLKDKIGRSVTGNTLVKRPYAEESRQQHPVTLWSR